VNERAETLPELLCAIESEMRRTGLWTESAPPPAALASRTPFCYDTLPLTQWIQWVLLPRMQLILDREDPWPRTSDIWPLAEHEFKKLEVETDRLLGLIRQFDDLVNER
jgi:uncharacterized protein YqcC (DUF446 family)